MRPELDEQGRPVPGRDDARTPEELQAYYRRHGWHYGQPLDPVDDRVGLNPTTPLRESRLAWLEAWGLVLAFVLCAWGSGAAGAVYFGLCAVATTVAMVRIRYSERFEQAALARARARVQRELLARHTGHVPDTALSRLDGHSADEAERGLSTTKARR